MAQYTDYYDGVKTGVNGVTVGTTTGTVLDVSMREQIGIVFTASAITSGNGVFSVDASDDGSNFVTGIAMVDATSTTPTTYVASKTLSSNTSAAMYLPLFPFRFMRIKCVASTDGTYTATMEAQG